MLLWANWSNFYLDPAWSRSQVGPQSQGSFLQWQMVEGNMTGLRESVFSFWNKWLKKYLYCEFESASRGYLICHLPFSAKHTEVLLQSIQTTAVSMLHWQTLWTERKTLRGRAQLSGLSEELMRIGAYKTNHITTYHRPWWFSCPLICPLHVKIDVCHYLPSPGVWLGSTDLFWGHCHQGLPIEPTLLRWFSESVYNV